MSEQLKFSQKEKQALVINMVSMFACFVIGISIFFSPISGLSMIVSLIICNIFLLLALNYLKLSNRYGLFAGRFNKVRNRVVNKHNDKIVKLLGPDERILDTLLSGSFETELLILTDKQLHRINGRTVSINQKYHLAQIAKVQYQEIPILPYCKLIITLNNREMYSTISSSLYFCRAFAKRLELTRKECKHVYIAETKDDCVAKPEQVMRKSFSSFKAVLGILLLVSVVYFAGMAFSTFLFSKFGLGFGILGLLAMTTSCAVWAYIDSQKIQIENHSAFFQKPIYVLLSVIIVWGICFPYYLWVRYKIMQKMGTT